MISKEKIEQAAKDKTPFINDGEKQIFTYGFTAGVRFAEAEMKSKWIDVNAEKLPWQPRDRFPVPTNPLQKLHEVLTLTSRDCSEDKMVAFMYGVILGWDDAYGELQEKHGWSDEDVRLQKMWHENYKKAWILLMNHFNQNQ